MWHKYFFEFGVNFFSESIFKISPSVLIFSRYFLRFLMLYTTKGNNTNNTNI